MRLWTLHPRYLDAKGLVAAWREALLAQKVLGGACRGYRHHPQLERFRARADPVAAIAAFLHALAAEAAIRGYRFDTTKIAACTPVLTIPETKGQLEYEWRHLKRKLLSRAPALARKFRGIRLPEPHPLFRIVSGGVRAWEKQPNPALEPTPRSGSRRRVALPERAVSKAGARSATQRRAQSSMKTVG